jgi:hypothetical protein
VHAVAPCKQFVHSSFEEEWLEKQYGCAHASCLWQLCSSLFVLSGEIEAASLSSIVMLLRFLPMLLVSYYLQCRDTSSIPCGINHCRVTVVRCVMFGCVPCLKGAASRVEYYGGLAAGLSLQLRLYLVNSQLCNAAAACGFAGVIYSTCCSSTPAVDRCLLQSYWHLKKQQHSSKSACALRLPRHHESTYGPLRGEPVALFLILC